MCLCTHKLCLLRASSSGICECACVTAASLLISSLPRGLLCFSAFFFPFFLWLKEQQAVTAPWALTDHSPQPGCQRSSNTQGSYGSFAGKLKLWTISSTLSNSPLLCSLLVTLHYVVVSKGDSGEDPKRKYWTCLKIDCSYVVISDNNTNCPSTARIF